MSNPGRQIIMVALLLTCQFLLPPRQAHAWKAGWFAAQYRHYRVYPRLHRAYYHLDRHEYPQAIAYLQEVLAIDPNEEGAREQLVLACLETKDYQCAFDQAEQLLAGREKKAVAALAFAEAGVQLGLYQELIDQFSRSSMLSQLGKQTRAELYRYLGQAYLRQGKEREALEMMTRLPLPGYFDLVTTSALFRTGYDFTGSILLLRQAYSLAADYSQALEVTLQLVDILLELERLPEADTSIAQLLRDFPQGRDDRHLLIPRILLALKLGRLTDFDQLIDSLQQGGKPEPAIITHWVSELEKQGYYGRALHLLGSLPQDWEQTIRAANLQAKLGNYGEAASLLAGECSSFPCGPADWRKIAVLYDQADDLPRAVAASRQALAYEPDNREMQEELLQRCLKSGSFAEAEELLWQRYRREPGPEVVASLLAVLEAKGATLDAVQLLQQVMSEKIDVNLLYSYRALADRLPKADRLAAYRWLGQRWFEPSAGFLQTFLFLEENRQQRLTILARSYPFSWLTVGERQSLIYRYAVELLVDVQLPQVASLLPDLLTAPGLQANLLAEMFNSVEAGEECGVVLPVLPTPHLLQGSGRAYAYMLRGLCARRESKLGLALGYWLQAAEDHELLTEDIYTNLLGDMAYALAQTGQLAEALQAFIEHYQRTQSHTSLVKAARQALSLGQPQLAIRLASKVVVDRLDTRVQAEFFTVKGDLMVLENDLSQAENYFRLALDLAPTGPLWQRWARLKEQQGLLDQAIQAMLAALQLDAENGLFAQQLAYLYVQTGEDDLAARWFELALRAEPDSLRLYKDLAYTRKRLADNPEAIVRLQQVIDNARFEVSATADQEEELRQELFRLRRELQVMDRGFLFSFATAYKFGGETLEQFGFAPVETALSPGFGEFAGYWQPPSLGYRNGATLNLGGRLLWGNEPDSLQIDPDTGQLALGLRYKPFAETNLVMSLEKFIAVGELSRDDWLVRFSGSLDQGLDWEPGKTNWPLYSLFIDSGWFAEAGTGLGSLQGLAGWNLQLPVEGIAVGISPYLLGSLSWNNDNEMAKDFYQSELGLGLGLWHWCNESKYAAYRTRNEVKFELHQPVGGNTGEPAYFLLRLSTRF